MSEHHNFFWGKKKLPPSKLRKQRPKKTNKKLQHYNLAVKYTWSSQNNKGSIKISTITTEHFKDSPLLFLVTTVFHMPHMARTHIHVLYCLRAPEKGDQEAATTNFAFLWLESHLWDIISLASAEDTQIKATLVAIFCVDAWEKLWW